MNSNFIYPVLSRLLLLVAGACFATQLNAQQSDSSFHQRISDLFLLQRYYYPQEKVHVHFDKNHYITGDTIWMRGYVVDASLLVPDSLSRYLYLELIDPCDSIAMRAMLRPEQGAFSGHFALPEGMPQGDYTIRGYTHFMKNAGRDYFFRAPVRISDPVWLKLDADLAFQRSADNRRVDIEFRFSDKVREGAPVVPDELKIEYHGEAPFGVRTNRDGVANTHLKTDHSGGKDFFRMSFDNTKRYVEIPPPPGEFDVSFFPEGGDMLAGTFGKVAFKALKPNGLSEDVSGEIFNSDDESITCFETIYKGMGAFSIIPEAGKTYYALCTDRQGNTKRFDLPQARQDALALCMNWHGGRMYVTVNRPAGQPAAQDLSLVVYFKGTVLYAEHIGKGEEPIRFEWGNQPTGIGHLLLLDEHRNTLSERLFFVRNGNPYDWNFRTDKPVYGYRERIRSGFTLNGLEGEPLKGSFSVAVIDDGDLSVDTTWNIQTNLLLTSDLLGYIESPTWYFDTQNPHSILGLDALMLTQGWRRYNLPELMREKVEACSVPPEIGQEISGSVTRLIGTKPSVETQVLLFSPAFFAETVTDSAGRFAFSGFEQPDSTMYYVQALSRRGNDRVELKLDPWNDTLPARAVPVLPEKRSDPENARDELEYIAKADRKWSMENGMRTIHMDAVSVKATRETDITKSIYGGMGTLYDEKYLEKNHIMQFEQLLYRMAGVQVSGANITIRGSNSIMAGTQPLFVIDNLVMDEDFDWRGMNMYDVESVEVMKGPEAAIFGMRGGNGAFIITTKTGKLAMNNAPIFNRLAITPLGYQKPAEFYSPKYQTAAQRNNPNPDLRTTVYWNPNLRSDEGGNVTFDFYAADSQTTYSVVIEGVTDDGTVIRAVEKIRRE